MANELDVPAQLYQALNERLQDNDKEAAIELYYELLSSGYSVGEILNGIGPARGKSGQSERATAEQPLSGPDEAAAGIASEIAVAEGEPAGTSWIQGLGGTNQAEGRGNGTLEAIRSVPPDALGSDDRERLRHEDWPGSEASVTGAAGADASPDRDGATGSGDRERPRFGGFSSLPRRIAFAAFYAAAVAAASMVGFSLLHGGGDTKPTIAGVKSDISGGTETVAVPGATADRAEADANGIMPKTQAVGADAAPAPKPSQSGEPDLATPRPLEPISVGVRTTVSAPRREAETAPQPNAGQPEAIGKLIEQSPDPAEAPRGSADGPDPSVAQSPSVTPAGPSETGQPETGEKPQAAPKDEAKATPSGPTETMPAASPSKAPVVEKRRESSVRRNGSRQSVERRTAARRPQPMDGGQAPVSNATAQGARPYYVEPARGYGYGAFGPSPYSDRGD